VEDGNALDVLKAKNCELESEVLELRKLKDKWIDDSNALVAPATFLERPQPTKQNEW